MPARASDIFKDTKVLLTWKPAVLLSIMNTKQRDILKAIFSEPAPKNLSWADIETLLTAIGCKVKNRGGSKVGFGKDNEMLYVHRPHPQKEAKGYVMRKVKDFLISLGVTP